MNKLNLIPRATTYQLLINPPQPRHKLIIKLTASPSATSIPSKYILNHTHNLEMHRRSPKSRDAHVPIIPQRILQLVRRYEAVRRPEALSNRHFRAYLPTSETDYGNQERRKNKVRENEWEKAELSLFYFFDGRAVGEGLILFCGGLWRNGLVGLDHGTQDKHLSSHGASYCPRVCTNE